MTASRSVLVGAAAILGLLGLVPVANVLAPGAVPWWDLAVRSWIRDGAIVLAVAVALGFTGGAPLDRLVERARELLLRPGPRVFAALAASSAVLAAAVLAWWCFRGQPFTSDEMAQQWHARILLGGRLAAIPEAWPEFFNTAPVFDRDGRWFSQYPVGGPALIALGLFANAAWLVNPLLLGVATWCLYLFFRRLGSELSARIATLLLVTSPMVLIMAASQMNHVPALAFAAVALAAAASWSDSGVAGRGRHARAAAVGLAIGALALVRPLDAVLLALVIGAFQLRRVVEEPSRLASLGTQALAGAVPVALLLYANHATTGSPLLFGYEALNGPAHGIGFHVDPTGESHTPGRGLVLASGYLMRLSRYLFEWPLPGMLFVTVGLALAPRTRWTHALGATALVFVIGYGAYWFDGFFSGPRFLFTAVPAFVYFAAVSPQLASRLASVRLRRSAILVLPLCVAASWLGLTGEDSALGRARSYREQRTKLKTDVEAQVERAGLHNALVFVNDGWRGRLLARLRVLGLTQFRADRLVSTLDACALQTALDEELEGPDRAERIERRARAYGAARPEPGLPADRAIALVPGTRPTPTCVHEFFRDTSGTMPYPMFLARQRLGPDGRVAGDVVFARDLGARNELLRDRFGERAWYVYVPARDLADDRPAFALYPEPSRKTRTPRQ